MRDKPYHLPSQAVGCLKGRKKVAAVNFFANCTVPRAEGRLCGDGCATAAGDRRRPPNPSPAPGHGSSSPVLTNTSLLLSTFRNRGLHRVPHFSKRKYSETSPSIYRGNSDVAKGWWFPAAYWAVCRISAWTTIHILSRSAVINIDSFT